MTEDPRDMAIKMMLLGLTTDGAYHKQWALEQALKALCEDDYVRLAKEELGWEPGIAP